MFLLFRYGHCVKEVIEISGGRYGHCVKELIEISGGRCTRRLSDTN